ncbi:unnamed protein product [Menidia menidia]|uniref:(Atlantic silverside) hypothetical protein n=1 Tax=Menidia menidia TaxID=238744 RepID=A0A8S4AVF7_9TELE|nr:unnamed protein product [Menidia menidia]
MQPQQLSREPGPLGRLSTGQNKLEGKTFYLDNVKKRSTSLLLEVISFFGGKVESFLHKDVTFVVTGSQNGLKEKSVGTKEEAKETSDETQHLNKQESGLRNIKPGASRAMVCGSRGKALLEKAICNNERLQGNDVLSNARSWGVRILYADDALLYLKQLTRESLNAIHKRTEKTSTKQGSPAVKAAALRSPFLKIEDLSWKYKPLHMQSMTFHTLYYEGRFSPFESPPPPLFEKQMGERDNKSRTSPWRPRKKHLAYCECCREAFTNLEEHLQSDQHRSFVLDSSNYRAVDQLMSEMLPGFSPNPRRQSEDALSRLSSPLSIHDVCELEPLTDVETEHAVQALQTQFSVIQTPVPGQTSGPRLAGTASPSPAFAIPNPAALPPGTPASRAEADCRFSNVQPDSPRPATPVLTLKPQPESEPEYLADRVSPCPSWLLPDPYSLPPVLSPQVPYSFYNTDPCSEPPTLSPQKYTNEETLEGQMNEMSLTKCVSTFPSCSAPFRSVPESNAEGERGPNSRSLDGFSGLVCSIRGLKSAALTLGRSCSLPHQSAVKSNPKKRCRSASPEHRHRKRRRTLSFGHIEHKLNETNRPSESRETVQSRVFTKDPCPDLNAPRPSIVLGHLVRWAGLLTRRHVSSPPKQQAWTLLLTSAHLTVISSQDSQRSLSHSTSICIEPALIPDLAKLSPSLSNSDWDCDLSRLGLTTSAPPAPAESNCELDKELLHRRCPWMHDTSYESHLHTVLPPATPPASLCREDTEAFSWTVVQIVEVPL